MLPINEGECGSGLKTKLEDFVVLGKLGSGSFSEVHKVRRVEDGRIYALKQVSKSISRSDCPSLNPGNKKVHWLKLKF